ncbi:hypothetical protein Barb7_01378 [Bacteroidales bacterium Barb7]|nr:hypothetical protein Barb7_01378 [Bacteroidales bacterium Barb7]
MAASCAVLTGLSASAVLSALPSPTSAFDTVTSAVSACPFTVIVLSTLPASSTPSAATARLRSAAVESAMAASCAVLTGLSASAVLSTLASPTVDLSAEIAAPLFVSGTGTPFKVMLSITFTCAPDSMPSIFTLSEAIIEPLAVVVTVPSERSPCEDNESPLPFVTVSTRLYADRVPSVSIERCSPTLIPPSVESVAGCNRYASGLFFIKASLFTSVISQSDCTFTSEPCCMPSSFVL